MPLRKKKRTFVPIFFEASKLAVRNGIRHAIFDGGSKYVGEWKNDKKHGKGAYHSRSGKLYEGDWYNGYRHGFGALSDTRPDQTYRLVYKGEWFMGLAHGIGWMHYEDDRVYFGFWQRGKRHGFGKLWYKNDFYCGQWGNDELNGLGMLVQANGNRYEGNWTNGLRNGHGRFYHLDSGQLQEGEWIEGICVTSKMEDIPFRQTALYPTQLPIPEIGVCNPNSILEEQLRTMIYLKDQYEMKKVE